MKLVVRIVLLSVALGLGGGSATAGATDAPAFRTPNKAVYCSVISERLWSLQCWTPNDGFYVWMTPKGRPHKGYSDGFRGHTPNRNSLGRRWPVLSFGETWHEGPWGCTGRSTGLECANRRDHGWWLGRFVGYRIF